METREWYLLSIIILTGTMIRTTFINTPLRNWAIMNNSIRINSVVHTGLHIRTLFGPLLHPLHWLLIEHSPRRSVTSLFSWCIFNLLQSHKFWGLHGSLIRYVIQVHFRVYHWIFGHLWKVNDGNQYQ